MSIRKKESENLNLLKNIKLEISNIQGELFLVRQELISVKRQMELKQKDNFVKISAPTTESQLDETLSAKNTWFWQS
jgi:hypothetical protein